jgi:transcriptional regulator with XRE-family HTH domain
MNKKLLISDPCVAFGAAVRRARVALNLSQEQLGDLCELDRTYISGIERGVRNPTLDTMVKISDALGCSLVSLLPTDLSRRGNNAI